MAFTGAIDFSNYIGAFMQVWEGPVGGDYSAQVANVYPVDSMVGVYPGLDNAPSMTTWTGGSTLDSLASTPSDYKITLTNQIYQNAVKYAVDYFTSAANPVFETNVRELALKARAHRLKLISGLLNNGHTGTGCQDGLAFFSASHAGGSNLLTNTDISDADVVAPAAPTAYEAATIINDLIAYMFTLKDSAGDVANGGMQSLKLITGNSKIYQALMTAKGQDILTNGTTSVTNPLKGFTNDGFKLDVTLDGTLTGNVIYAVRTDTIVKPFIVQEKGAAPEIITLGPGTEYTQNSNNVLFGCKAVRAAGYGRYQAAAKLTLS